MDRQDEIDLSSERFVAIEYDQMLRNIEAMTSSPPIESKDDVALSTAASYVLWDRQRHRLGYEPGSFYASLLETCFAADLVNLQKLSKVFPNLAWCVLVYRYHINGPERLEALADPDGHVLPVEFGGDDQELF